MRILATLLIAGALAFSCLAAEKAKDDDAQVKLLLSGRELLTNNRPLDAISQSFDKVIRQFETEFDSKEKRVYCARSPEEALFYMAIAANDKQSASVIGPTWSDAHYLKAYALMEVERISEAQDSLKRALELSPQNSMYLGELAYTYQVQRNWAESLATFKEAEEAADLTSPEDQKVPDRTRALRGQGFSLVELGMLDEAEAKYREAIAADPADRASKGEIQYIQELRAREKPD